MIGAGVVGQATALALQRAGVATTLLDREAAPRGASWGNAGHIAVEQVAPLASRAALYALPRRLFARGGPVALPWREAGAWLPFGLRLIGAIARFEAGSVALSAMLAEAIPAWRRLLDGAGARDLLREDGHFVVWESAASARAGTAAWAAADTGTARLRGATDEEMARLRTLVRVPVAGALRFEGSARIEDTGALAEVLRGGFVNAGGTLRQAAVTRFVRHNPNSVRAELVEVPPLPLKNKAALRPARGERSLFEADLIVVAAGARADALLRPLGHIVPLIAERGYHIHAPANDWPEHLPPVVFEDRAMIVTRFRSGLRAAGFTEFARVDAPPDPRKWARLRDHAAVLGLPFTEPVARWSGARPTLPDYLPAIGRSGRASNLIYAFGHQHLGLTLAATTAAAVAALALGHPPPYDLSPFTLDRFARRTFRKAA